MAFHRPEIPGNTGSAIRLAACTGALLHLVRPLGFALDDAKLRRAGLDYHDLARVRVHDDLPALWAHLRGTGGAQGRLPRVFAFTARATRRYTDVAYAPGDVLLFGAESVGLPEQVLHAGEVTDRLRVPMLAGRRSLNLASTAAIAVHEAWRQHGFAGADEEG
jgi:tRNA (cytidine/uridine-2'-O-)-methyltransferase